MRLSLRSNPDHSRLTEPIDFAHMHERRSESLTTRKHALTVTVPRLTAHLSAKGFQGAVTVLLYAVSNRGRVTPQHVANKRKRMAW